MRKYKLKSITVVDEEGNECFNLLGVVVEHNYKRKTYTYRFEVVKFDDDIYDEISGDDYD